MWLSVQFQSLDVEQYWVSEETSINLETWRTIIISFLDQVNWRTVLADGCKLGNIWYLLNGWWQLEISRECWRMPSLIYWVILPPHHICVRRALFGAGSGQAHSDVSVHAARLRASLYTMAHLGSCVQSLTRHLVSKSGHLGQDPRNCNHHYMHWTILMTILRFWIITANYGPLYSILLHVLSHAIVKYFVYVDKAEHVE